MQNSTQKIEGRCKGVHCVDLGESFPTSIYSQKSASIQPRTSPSKFGGKFNALFICLLKDFAKPRVSRSVANAFVKALEFKRRLRVCNAYPCP